MIQHGIPFDQWTAGDIKDGRETDPAVVFIGYATKPALLSALRARYKEKSEEEIKTAMEEAVCAGAGPECIQRVGRWLLRNYALIDAWTLFLRAPDVRGFIDLLMPRLLVTVWIGILAVCGSSPWTFLDSLSSAAKITVIALCFGFSVLGRLLVVLRGTAPSTASAFERALFITAWGWLSGLVLLWIFTAVFGLSDGYREYARSIWRSYWAVMPSIGSAVGVLLQELWDERPISEPL